ncbi:hypothetical protein Taro_052516 [Colocasia esculenta]|uniref:Uncharacterized protein n=1 Tax=Colocasia esculenta TaxID=4460 RepID=A0A843XK43_COLES|nr:hypothetical protein [Colocasia esculenta]
MQYTQAHTQAILSLCRRRSTRGVTERRLSDGQQWNVFLIRGYGVGPIVDIFTSRMGILTYQWERIEKTDRQMLAHMSAIVTTRPPGPPPAKDPEGRAATHRSEDSEGLEFSLVR